MPGTRATRRRASYRSAQSTGNSPGPAGLTSPSASGRYPRRHDLRLKFAWAMARLAPLRTRRAGVLLVLAVMAAVAYPAFGQVRTTLKGHALALASVAYSPDGKVIATGSYDRTAKVWEAATGKEIVTLNGHSATVDAVAFSPDAKTLATGSYASTVKPWR